MFYPIARDELLEKHAWRFALTRETLAAARDSTRPTQWSYAYAIPNGCVRPLAVLLQGEIDDNGPQPYEIETAADGQQILLTNAPAGATLKYIIQQTDTTKFTPLFVVALSWRWRLPRGADHQGSEAEGVPQDLGGLRARRRRLGRRLELQQRARTTSCRRT
jgi:hypothetical protein